MRRSDLEMPVFDDLWIDKFLQLTLHEFSPGWGFFSHLVSGIHLANWLFVIELGVEG